MAGFGIPASQLSLRPSEYLQHRRARRSQDIGEAQYQRSRQDSKDRFAETMASQEATRKADFAKTEFLEEQKLIRDRAKTKASLLDDIAKNQATIEKDIKDKGWKYAIENGEPERVKEYEDFVRRTRYPDTVQAPPIQPQFQPAGAEGGYDTRLDQPAPIQEGRADIKDKFTEMYPYGTEGDQVLGTQEPETPIARELTLDEINQQVLEEAAIAKQAQAPVKPAPKEEIPEAIRKTGHMPIYRRTMGHIKTATKQDNRIETEKSKLRDIINSKTIGINKKPSKDRLKALTAKQDKLKIQVRNWGDKLAEIEMKAGKELEGKIEKMTVSQKIGLAQKILVSDSYDEKAYTPKQVKWAEKLIAKYTGGAGTQQAGGADKAIAQRVGEIITKGGKKWVVVGFDVDGEPMVDPAE